MIPARYLFAMLLILVEIALVIAGAVVLTIMLPFSYTLVVVTQLGVAISLVGRNDNPDYKLPWLFFILLLPIIGFMLYFMFYTRKLSRRARKRLAVLKTLGIERQDGGEMSALFAADEHIATQAQALCSLSSANLYRGTDIRYFSLGDDMFPAMVEDLKKAEKFIFMEYFIIERGLFWDTILGVLEEKAAAGVDVRVVYDDIGCMKTLPSNYYKRLTKAGIKCVPFFKLVGQANGKFNNRSHRKITVIDGKVGYTGGINLADEYINEVERFGHWKDAGLRLEGEAVNELTRLFLIDYHMNTKKHDDVFADYYIGSGEAVEVVGSGGESGGIGGEGWCIPFGDGPRPIFERRVTQTALLNMLGGAKHYVYMTTPYLIIDNELTAAIENAALRGVDVRIITPHIPDKKLVFSMTRSYYPRLMAAGVKIFEYEKGFIHAKTYLADGEVAIVGTVNLDYRSLVHHFENGVWMYRGPAVAAQESDFLATQSQSIEFRPDMLKQNLWQRFVRALVKIFAPLL